METKFAVITGASSGMGLELAKQFGHQGHELLICSGEDAIFDTQRELEELGITVEAMKINLGGFAGVENLFKRIQNYGKILDVVVINATPGLFGDFTNTNLNDEIASMNLNIISAVHLSKRILQDMKLRHHGEIIFACPIASQYEAVFSASRSFLSSFAEHLRSEAKEYGVTISVHMPGTSESILSKAMKMIPERFKKGPPTRPSELINQ